MRHPSSTPEGARDVHAASSPPTPFTLAGPRVRPWTRTTRETVGRYKVFDVERSTFVRPDGVPLERPFFTFTCNPWCIVLPVTDAGEMVLVWQYRHGSDVLSLEPPGGVVDPGEAPIDAARRELAEETGYGAHSLEPLMVVQPNPALQGNECHVFVARGASLEGAPNFDDTEECEVVTVPVRVLPELLDRGAFVHALAVCALERFLRKEGEPSAGRDGRDEANRVR